MRTRKFRILFDDLEVIAKVDFDLDNGYVTLTLDDSCSTEIRFDWATIEELASKMKEIEVQKK